MKGRNDAIFGNRNVIEIAADKVDPSKLDYGESCRICINGSN